MLKLKINTLVFVLLKINCRPNSSQHVCACCPKVLFLHLTQNDKKQFFRMIFYGPGRSQTRHLAVISRNWEILMLFYFNRISHVYIKSGT